MKEFPNHLVPENKEKFSKYRYNENISYLRKEIYDLMLRGNENLYFELDVFSKRHTLKKPELERMTKTITKELNTLGWNVKTSFGETGLFIYSTKDPPPYCYKDEF